MLVSIVALGLLVGYLLYPSLVLTFEVIGGTTKLMLSRARALDPMISRTRRRCPIAIAYTHACHLTLTPL